MADMLSVRVDAEAVARSLDLHDDFRVLRRMREMDKPANPRNRDVGRVGIAIDVETTGLDPDKHEVIELAVQRFRIDDAGCIIETGQPRTWLEQPSIPIPREIERITGLTDADIAGRTINDGEATSMIRDVDFVVAHNASFDRPFVEARLPLTADQPWICSLADIDWQGFGYQDRTLSGLLAQMGYFYDAHRAQTDVSALLHLLDHVPSGGSKTVCGMALERAQSPRAVVKAIGAPFSERAALRARGYRWNPEQRTWFIEVAEKYADREHDWLSQHVYRGRGKPLVKKIAWETRFSRR